jgi:iduronate 2-sulfatase
MRLIPRVVLTLIVAAFPLLLQQTIAAEKPNVLFIAIDDLRPELGCYGNKTIHSPNIDRLAERGFVFNRAYCQQAVCSPSRSSLLTGRRPDTTKVYDLETHFRAAIPDVITLPQWFKQHGYETAALSKIYHPSVEDPESWTIPHWKPPGPVYGPEGQKQYRQRVAETKKRGKGTRWREDRLKGLPWEAAEVADNALPDGQTADKAIELLNQLTNKPFFLAVGFHKPHLPFVSPKKYWDLYDEKQLRLAANPFRPKDSPDYASTEWGELRAYIGMPQTGPLTEEQARKMVHGYYAAVSYTDAQIGRVLDELDRRNLREKTIVILWGDHGWQLGEHGLWCKHTNFELATRAPLIISVPAHKSAGKKTDALVEFVDIYPSLVELCGLPVPAGLEGTSFRPLLDDPSRAWQKPAISQYPRNIPGQGRGMGYSLRTDQYRLTEWSVPGKDFREYELYDHKTDPAENINIARDPKNAQLISELAALLHQASRTTLRP